MAKYTNKPKMNIPMCLAGVLFCLTMVSVYMVSGLYARYSTSGTGSDSARVIKFGDISISETGDFQEGTKNMVVIPGVDLAKKAVVNFEGSEAATYVFVEVDLAGPWEYDETGKTFHIDVMDDTMVDWSVAGGWQYLKGTKYVFYRELGPNTPLSADIIGAISETDTRNGIRVSESINKATMANMESTTITFRASVVQSNGFENVQAAWASLQSKKEVQA